MKATVSTLKNGLRVASIPMPSLETVSIGVYADVGTRHEDAAHIGISHMFEHMVFKGTQKRSARHIAEEIEAVGGHLNAYTTRDMTAYYARVLKDDVPLAVDILADLLINARFDPHEVARERDVIAQEIGQSLDTPDDVIFDHLQACAYSDQPLGYSILGSVDSVSRIDADALKTFRAKFYSAENLIIAAAGKLDHADLVALAEQAFAFVPTSTRHIPQPASYKGGDHRDVRALEQVHLAFAFEGIPYTHDDIYALQLYGTILGGGMSSRLFQDVREEHGLAYAVFSDIAAHSDTGLVTLYAGTSPTDAGKATRLIADVTKSMTDPVDEAELARAKAQLKAGLAMSLESSTAQSEQLGRHMLMFDRPIPAAEILERVDAVSAKDVARVACERLDQPALSFASVGPQIDLPDYDQLNRYFKA